MGKPDYEQILNDIRDLQNRVDKLEKIVGKFAPLSIIKER